MRGVARHACIDTCLHPLGKSWISAICARDPVVQQREPAGSQSARVYFASVVRPKQYS